MRTNNFFTNRIEYIINRDEILKNYDLIKLTIEKNMKVGDIYFSKLWNILKSSIEAKAYYANYKEIYILTQKNEIDKIDKKTLSNLECEVLLLDYFSIKNIPNYILANILITKVDASDSMFSIGNFQNGLYVIHEKKQSKIISIRFHISKDDILQFDVVTFSKTLLNNNTKNSIFYITEFNKLIRVVDPSTTTTALYTKGNRFGKSNIKFITYYKDFEKSKVGYLAKFLKLVNNSFLGLLNIQFKKETFVEYETFGTKVQRVGLLKNKICEILESKRTIYLSDYENLLDDKIKKNVEKSIKEYFINEIDIRFIQKLDSNVPSLVFIKDKEDYKDGNDPYNELKVKYKKSQIVKYSLLNKILEEKPENRLYLQVILKELIIKLEIIENNFLLSNKLYDFLGYQFFLPNIDSWDKIVFTENGFKKEDFTILDGINIEILDINKSIIELIAFKGNEYFAIEKTDIKILSDVLKTYEINKTGESIKRKIYQKYTLAGKGIHYKLEDGYFEYFSATNTENLAQSVSKANNIRKVYSNNKNFDYDVFFSSMDEYYIRNKEFTVLPIVVKYLNEYMELQKA